MSGRWLVDFLVNRCVAMRPGRREWAVAMRREIDEVPDGERVRWAAGCLGACYADRFLHPEVSPGRVCTAIGLAMLAFGDTFAAALTAAYRLHFTRIAATLGALTPGDDYRRLIPLMEGLPLWLHGLSVMAAACYFVAIIRMFFHGRAPYIPVLAAVLLELATDQLGRPFIKAIGVAANPNPSMFAILFPVLVPLALAAFLWRLDCERSNLALE